MIRLEGFIGEEQANAAEVARRLAHLDGAPAEIVINSAGGSAFEGAAIHAELRAHRGEVNVFIRGIAASAASLIAMAGDRIVMDSAAVLMIHDPSAITIGPANAHRKGAETLEKLADVYAKAYAEQTGNSVANVRRWMADETWLSADEALALNFIDEIEEHREPEMAARCDYTAFARAPAELVKMARAQGWVKEPAELQEA